MSWSTHVGNTRNHQSKWNQVRLSNTYTVKNNRKHHPKNVSTSIKIISCALALLLITAPVIAAAQQSACLPVRQADMRGVLINSSWPSTYKASALFIQTLSEIPASLKVSRGLTDFFEEFVQKYNSSRKETYPNLPQKKVEIASTVKEDERLALATFLFSIYEAVETGPESHGCLWRSKIHLMGSCYEKMEKKSRYIVDYLRSSLFDLRKPKIIAEIDEQVIVERNTYEAVQQRAIFTFDEDGLYVEVISHIQEERFDPPLELRHLEEREPNCD